MKKLISFIIVCALCLGAFSLSACSNTTQEAKLDPENMPVHVSDDKYRNYYHIWVCSFNDSNGDEVGDINGIIEKLDYINDGDPTTDTDLGLDGIWLSPIMPSDSYHKYDVDNYMDIDPEFGTLEDFDRLIAECDKRGITVILDLVPNHCGTGHEYWKKAVEEVKAGNFEGYAKYYRFTSSGGFPGEGYRQLGGCPGVWYEGQFSTEMPEWNLAYEGTREYFEEVAKFWLDRGVGGFRLDAVKYMTDETTDGVEFLNWFYTTAQKYKPDVYMVGENWQGNSELYEIYQSGIDSQFAFSFATASGNIASAVKSGDGKSLAAQLKKFDDNSHKSNENVINAMFLSNHDTLRSGNYFPAGLTQQKMAAATYLLMPGNSFTYYGEEIGMKTPSANSKNDAYFRGPMIWDSDVEPDIWCTADAYSELPYGGVKQQTDDENSLLSFYRDAIKVKNQNYELARGKVTETVVFDNSSICAFKVVYNETELLVIHNLDDESAATLEITEEILKNAVVTGSLVAGDTEDKVELKDGKLTLPAQSSAILRTNA